MTGIVRMVALLIGVLVAGCTGSQGASPPPAGSPAPSPLGTPAASTPSKPIPIKGHEYRTDLDLRVQAPEKVVPGAAGVWTISVRQEDGRPLKRFEVQHEHPMHLFITNEDLSYFAHVHPKLTGAAFTVRHALPRGGRYRFWADTKPEGGRHFLGVADVAVPGMPKATAEIATEERLRSFSDDGRFRTLLRPPSSLMAGRRAVLTFHLAHRDGSPVTSLERWMGAKAHLVLLSEDQVDFMHAHPAGRSKPDWRGGPELMVPVHFPRGGFYRIWLQFQEGGQVSTTPFIVEVEGDGKEGNCSCCARVPAPVASP